MEDIEKIDKEIAKLYDTNDELIDILAFAGCDSETHYSKEYWDIVDATIALREALQAVLNEHSNVVLDLHEWLNPTSIDAPFRKTNIVVDPTIENISKAAGL